MALVALYDLAAEHVVVLLLFVMVDFRPFGARCEIDQPPPGSPGRGQPSPDNARSDLNGLNIVHVYNLDNGHAFILAATAGRNPGGCPDIIRYYHAMTEQHRHRVVALVSPLQSTFELACAAEVFGMSRPGIANPYQFSVCAERPGPLSTRAGYDMLVRDGLTALEDADTIVIAGWPPPRPTASPRLLRALRSAHRQNKRIVAICSGAFPLAEAGLLDHRRATTHWRLAEEFAARHPDVNVDPDVLYVDHGDVATSAGTSAGIDLCLHLLRTDYGAGYAAHVARHMVMPPHREGGQLQYAAPAATPTGITDSLAPLLDWAAQNLHKPLFVSDLAVQARVSPRTLTRRFLEQVGASPGRWVLAQRIAATRQLLEQTDLPVETIASRVGLSTATNLRRRFHQAVRTTPAAYRRTFRGG